MTTLRIKAGPYEFEAQTEDKLAPITCAKFVGMLPYRQQIIHGLLYQRRDLRLLCIGGVNLDVQMLQHMIDVSGNISGAIVTCRHPMMKTTCAHPGRGGHPDDAAEESSSGDKGD